jgi:hypothetical protein
MSFTMDNGLFAALFRLDCTIVERHDELILQWNIYVERQFLIVTGIIWGIHENAVTIIAMSVSPII